MPNKKYVIGAILITVSIALSIIYVTWQSQGLRMKIDKDKSTFYMYVGKWNTTGIEYNHIYNGSKRISKTGSVITVEEFVDSLLNKSTIIRTTIYPQGYKVIDTYLFDGSNKDTELFPVEHKVKIENAEGLRYMYQVTKLKYSGQTINLNTYSYQFGRMKVAWSPGYLTAKLFSTGRLEITYPIFSETQEYDVRLFDPAVVCTFNGMGNLTKYEYGTTAVVNCTSAATIIVDQTVANFSVAANVAGNYKLDTLRQNLWQTGKTTVKTPVPNAISIFIDNRTELLSFEFNISSADNDNPRDVKIDNDYDNTAEIFLKGLLQNQYLINNNFTYEGMNYNAVNVSMSDIGYIIFYAKLTAWNVINNITFSLTGYNLNPVGVDFLENFTNKNNIQNYTQADTNMFEWMSFEKSTIGRGTTPTTEWDWTDTVSGSSSSCTSFSYDSSWLHNVTDQKTDDYLDQQGTTTGGCICGYAQYCDWSITTTGTHTTKIMDIKDYNRIGLKWTLWETYGGSARPDYCQSYVKILITDGTNSVEVYSTTVGSFNVGEQTVNVQLDLIKQDNIYNWNSSAVKGSTPSSSIYSLSALNAANDWQLILKTYYATNNYKESNHWGSEGCTTSGKVNLYEVNASGISLHEYVNGSYDPYFIFFSKSVFNPVQNITAVKMTVDSTVPSGTTLGLYVSADNHTTEETITSGVLHFFSSAGNKLAYKINGTTTNTSVSPEIRSVRLEVIASTPANVTVDIGNDGDNEWTYTGVMNTTQSVTADSTDITTFLQAYCLRNETCIVPIGVTSESPGVAMINNLVVNQSHNPISLGVSNLESYNTIKLNMTGGSGTVNLSDLKLDFRGSKNVTLDAGGTTYQLQIKYSKFNVTLPPNIFWYDVYTGKFGGRNARNATPAGQTNTTPIWTVKNEAYDDPIDVFVWLDNIDIKINLTVSSTNDNKAGKNYSFGWAYCYQETATVNNSCGGLSTGAYLFTNSWTNPNNVIDGDWTSAGEATCYNQSYIYINYTVPDTQEGTIIWQTNDAYYGTVNSTLPTACSNSTKLQLRGESLKDCSAYVFSYLRWQCLNGSIWQDVKSYGTPGQSALYEEGVYWKISQPVINLACSSIAINANCSLWNWWDIYNYTEKYLYMPTMKFSAMCSNCTDTSDYLQTNVIEP